jgi:hypothetical protein
MCVAAEGLGHDLVEPGFDLIGCLARGEAGAVADAEDVGIDGERLFAPGGVENDIGGFAPDPGQGLKLLARARDLAAILVDQCPA